MRTILHSFGGVSAGEARLLSHDTERQEHPNPAELAQGEVRNFDLQADQLPEEVLELLRQNIDHMRQEANETAASELNEIISTAQRDIDAINSSPGVSPRFITNYLADKNGILHGRNLHMSVANGHVRISPRNPAYHQPQEIARRNRIKELMGQIKAVDIRIQKLRLSQGAVQNRMYKGTSMEKRSIESMVELEAMKFQLEQELDGVRTRRITVQAPVQAAPEHVPVEPTEDPSLINDPRFVPGQRPEKRFDLSRSPDGAFGEGGEAVSAEEEARVGRMCERWKNSETEEERETVEGFLMMEGVDIDASDIANDKVTVCPREERGMHFLMGLVMVLKSFLNRLSKKETPVDKVEIGEKDASEMTEEERTMETDADTKKLQDFKDQKDAVEAGIKDIDGKLNDTVSPPNATVREDLKNQLKQKKQEIKILLAEIKKLEDRITALASGGEVTKGKDVILKGEQLKDDPLYKHFEKMKIENKAKMQASLQQFADSGNFKQGMEGLARLFGVDMKDRKNMKEMWQKAIHALASIPDLMSMEKNGVGEYRVRFDVGGIHRMLTEAGLIDGTEVKKFTSKDVEEFIRTIPTSAGMRLSVEGTTAVTNFINMELMEKEMEKF